MHGCDRRFGESQMGSGKKPKRWSKSQQDEQMCQDLDPRHRHVKSDNREPAASSSTIGRDVEGALSLRPRTTFQDDKGDKNTSNMLATSNFGSTSSQPHKFLPSVPSPLSPRRANVQASSSSFWSFDTSMTTSTPQQASNQQSHVPFSSRPVKTAPVPRSDALRERRRDMFLRKVRQSRDDNKWDSRIDDMARLDYLKEKRRWEAEQVRSAPPLYPDLPDAEEDSSEYDLPTYNNQMAWDPRSQSDYPLDQEADAILQQENEELEALVALMQEDENRRNQQSGSQDTHDDRSSAFGSDDDEYDSIFMDMIDETGGAAPGSEQQQHENPHPADDEMDLS